MVSNSLEEEVLTKTYIPNTREGKIAMILETVRHSPGLSLQTMIDRFAFKLGSERETVVSYFKALSRANLIRISKDMKVYPREENE